MQWTSVELFGVALSVSAVVPDGRITEQDAVVALTENPYPRTEIHRVDVEPSVDGAASNLPAAPA